jgi:hypothetical protein
VNISVDVTKEKAPATGAFSFAAICCAAEQHLCIHAQFV